MLRVNDLTLRIGERLILDGASFAIPEGARVGLVGRNGAGKTTLFKAILGEWPIEANAVSMPRGMRIGAVAQEAPAGPETLHAVVLAADTERARLIVEAEGADGLRRAEIETRLVDIGAHSAPARAAAILHGLGFDASAQGRPCADFSGGWRMRVALAAVLFSEPDLLLLDEPTNYLDIEGTIWLYDYLERYPRTAIIISHDRDLLDESVDHILHLDRGKLTIYRGGYTSFARQLSEKRVLQAKAKVKQDAERAHLQSFIDRFKAKATKARQAQSRVKKLARMVPIAGLIEDDVPVIHLPSPERPLAPPIVAMERVQAGYPDRIVLSGLNLSLAPDDRVALLGANGNGKSTFCKLIGGRLDALSGDLRRSSKMKVAYFAQHQLDELRPAESAVAHLRSLMPDAPEARVRAATARLGFPANKADTPVAQLSGGEKARLLMGLAAFDGPHLLILDEPTNHLDIESRQALVAAINDYEGAVILVSHDRFLVEACADRLWLVADGSVKTFDGDMDDYRRLVLAGPERDAPREADAAGGRPAEARRSAVERRAALAPLRKRLEGLEARMERLTAAIAKIDAALGDGSAFRENAAKAGEIAKMRADAVTALAAAEEEWLEVSGEIEAAA
ncbi:ABC-F family ATP-binding cassette domain-containing protein [uncultured Methylobacterium sp.]|uniref:ABC-F family ATP-binding cassette domain-containing protein n=1 Tax=uncultured Methylobacterium sp. TaxID=157278 RepID=UPI0035C9C507